MYLILIIELKIKLQGPSVNNFDEWPMSYKVYKKGALNVYFANGDN